jgi:hypothetical protein
MRHTIMTDNKTILFSLILIITINAGCASWWKTDVVVSYEPPRCDIIWESDDRAELIAFMDSELPSDKVFEKIAEYRRYCNAVNDYINGAE